MTPVKLPVAVYLRISSDPLGLRAGIERQRTDCETLAGQRFAGHPIIVYTDNDVSAYSGKLRPGFRDMTGTITTGSLHALIAYNFDRLFRLPRELESFIDLCDRHKFRNVITVQGDIDLSTHDGQLHARILAAVAKKSSDDTSRRVARASADRRDRGLWTGRPPFGYRLEPGSILVLDNATAPALRSAINAALAGASLRSLCVMRVHPDAPTTSAGWKSTLLSTALSGVNSAGISGGWEPVIDSTTAATLKALLTAPTRGHRQGNGLKHWLSGVLVCGKCNGFLRFHTDTRTRATMYTCKTCFGCAIMAPRVEKEMAGQVIQAAADAKPARRDDRGKASRRAVEARLEEVAALYISGDVSRAVFDAAKKAAATVAPDHNPGLPVKDLDKAWKGLTATEKRAVAFQYLEHVVVAESSTPGFFDPERLTPKWTK
jgi:DNA invertase Pin-like site-specific DNA recombinase